MKISLIIPTAYTPEPYFSNCMKRVSEETREKNFEVIISEDGPGVTDEMRALYPEWAIVLKHPEASGCGQARKRAQEICTGDVVCFLDSDDLMARGYYELIKDAWEKHPDASCIEFGFNNVYKEFTETLFCDDPESQTYGNFSYEMVWNKTYKGEYVREASKYYNPPLMMTPAEDLLWNTVYQSLYNCDYVRERKLLLDRIVRNNGLAHSTAADVKNRIKMMQYSLDVAKSIGTYSPIYSWILNYIADLENELKKGCKGLSGYKWNNWDDSPSSTPRPLFFVWLDECTAKCSYCSNPNTKCVKAISEEQSKEIARKFEDALLRWEKLYGLPNTICISGGEPTLCNPEDFAVLFKKYKDIRFIICTNGFRMKEWHNFDNLVFRVHSLDGNVKPEILFDDKVVEYIYVDEKDTDKMKGWEKLAKLNPKIYPAQNLFHKDINEDEIKSCRQVEGTWVVDLTKDSVKPCLGNKVDVIGTIEARPCKKDCTTCNKCTNASDNYME